MAATHLCKQDLVLVDDVGHGEAAVPADLTQHGFENVRHVCELLGRPLKWREGRIDTSAAAASSSKWTVSSTVLEAFALFFLEASLLLLQCRPNFSLAVVKLASPPAFYLPALMFTSVAPSNSCKTTAGCQGQLPESVCLLLWQSALFYFHSQLIFHTHLFYFIYFLSVLCYWIHKADALTKDAQMFSPCLPADAIM